jgi:hypothetical protein
MVSQLGNHLGSDKGEIQKYSFIMQPQFNASDIDNGVGFSLYYKYLMATMGF